MYAHNISVKTSMGNDDLWANHALTTNGWKRNVRLEIDEIGVIAGIATDLEADPASMPNAISCFPPYRTYTVTRFNAPWPV